MLRRILVLRLFVLSCVVLVGLPLAATAQQLTLSGEGVVYTSTSPATFVNLNSATGPLFSDTNGTGSGRYVPGGGSWIMQGSVNYTILRANVSAAASQSEGSNDWSVGASAFLNMTVRDRIVIKDPRLTGTIGRLNRTGFGVSGDYYAVTDTGESTAGYQAYLSLTSWDAAGNVLDEEGQGAFGSTDTSTGDRGTSPPIALTPSVSFIYGQPIDLQMELRVDAGANGSDPYSGSAGANFSHTARWLGFGSVTDASGHPVTDYTAIGLSGTNWAAAAPGNAVPEPGAFFLLLGAGCASGLFLRRRRE